jgi:hypothetical protein
MYDVGKVVSLSESGMTITCYRPEKTKGTAYPSLPPIGGNRFWALDVNISKVKDIIANHNSTLYKRLYGGATDNGVRVYPFVINLSKLPHHESIED